MLFINQHCCLILSIRLPRKGAESWFHWREVSVGRNSTGWGFSFFSGRMTGTAWFFRPRFYDIHYSKKRVEPVRWTENSNPDVW